MKKTNITRITRVVLFVVSVYWARPDSCPRFAACYDAPSWIRSRVKNSPSGSSTVALMKVYDVFVANCVGALEHLARMESSSPAAMFIKACELQERCRGLTVRDFLLMPLEVGSVKSEEYLQGNGVGWRGYRNQAGRSCPPVTRDLVATILHPPCRIGSNNPRRLRRVDRRGGRKKPLLASKGDKTTMMRVQSA